MNRTLFLSSILFLILVSLALLYFFQIFKIKKIIIISQEPTFYGLDIFQDASIFSIRKHLLEKEFLKQNPHFKRITIQQQYPSTVIVDTVLRTPIVVVSVGGKLWLTDQDGYILSSIDGTQGLPLVELTDTKGNISRQGDWRIVKAIRLIDASHKLDLRVANIRIEEELGSFSLFLRSGTEAVIDLESDPFLIASSLQMIMGRFRIEGKLIEKVDFRYEKPVVLLKNEQ